MKRTKFKKVVTLFLSVVLFCMGFNLQSSANNNPTIYETFQGHYYVGYNYYTNYAYNGCSKKEKCIGGLYHEEDGSPYTDAEMLAEVAYWENFYKPNYPNASLVKDADVFYNAHFYAFFKQENAPVTPWVENPLDYLVPYAWKYEVYCDFQPRDIVCYFNDNGTPYDQTDDILIHSGIISGYSGVTQSNGQCGDIDLYTVDSKWGFGGVYHHNGYECPYTNYCNPDGELRANSVRYFRFPNHGTHKEAITYKKYSETFHQSICSCGQIIYEPHNLELIVINPGVTSATTTVDTNGVVVPPLEEMVCADCGFRPLQ